MCDRQGQPADIACESPNPRQQQLAANEDVEKRNVKRHEARVLLKRLPRGCRSHEKLRAGAR